MDDPRYAMWQLDEMNQLLPCQLNRTSDPERRVRIDRQGNNDQPISIPYLLSCNADNFADYPALVSKPNAATGKRTIFTYQEYRNQVLTVAKGFISLGLTIRQPVCILGSNSPQWIISYLAAIHVGGIAVGIYTTSSAEALQYCVQHSKARIIVVEDDKLLKSVLEIKKNLPDVKAIVQYEGVPSDTDNAIGWDELLNIGSQLQNVKLNNFVINECCVFVYALDALLNPKAVMLNHDNLLSNARALVRSMNLKGKGKTNVISFMPLANVTNQVLDIFLPMLMAGTVYFTDNNGFLDTVKKVRPSILFAGTREWQAIYAKAQALNENNSAFKRGIMNWAINLVTEYHMKRLQGDNVRALTVKYRIAKSIVFNKLKAALGLDKCDVFGTSTTPLNTDVKENLMRLDIIVADSYGMSECSGIHTFTKSNDIRLGSVGRTLPGFHTQLKIVNENGEGQICMRGRHMFMGYLYDPVATSRVYKDSDNKAKTEDLGKVDADGFLYIKGKIYELSHVNEELQKYNK